ncbi:hypothetical protein EVAR_24555_1 [Eumeta japonica]|uniref:Uncharacterized protein n=1 Tax=Eumeta variegata TaxID=151549 RepID=A0A4C1URD6_EUMVA|nr:hypothetical protein EVAR_24555_1 [Eumeta japonica]
MSFSLRTARAERSSAQRKTSVPDSPRFSVGSLRSWGRIDKAHAASAVRSLKSRYKRQRNDRFEIWAEGGARGFTFHYHSLTA